MTANLRIVPYNDHDDAVLTASAVEAAGFEVANTQNRIRSRTWRTTSLTTQTLLGVLSASRVANAFHLFVHHLAGASVRLQLYSDAAWTTPASPFADSGTVAATCYTPAEPYVWSNTGTNDPYVGESAYWNYFAATTYRSYKLTVSGTPTGYTYFEVARVWLGKYLGMTVNPVYGAQLGYADQTERNRSRGGSLRSNVGSIWRTLNCELDNVGATERATWLQIMRRCGTGRDVVVSVFPGDGTSLERDYTINGVFVNIDALGMQVSRSTKRLQLEEC